MKLGGGRINARLGEIGQEFGHGLGLELGRVKQALQAMGRPQDRLPPVLHVAGTNGKGSVCAYLRAIGEASGLRVHVFTSPHLILPNERIRLAGRLIDDETFLAALERVHASGVTLTYFEAITAAALHAFAETPADWLVMEVGLGGRFDATNVLDTALSVITPLGLDHQAMLGPGIEQIASAKAGVLRAARPSIIARQPSAAMAVIEAEAAQLGTHLLRCGSEWDAYAQRGQLIVQTAEAVLDLPAPALPGPHQFDNAGLAVMAALAMDEPRVTPQAVAQGLRQVRWPGRLQALTRGPLARLANGAELWLDGGHNAHAAAALAAALLAMQAQRPVPLAHVQQSSGRGVVPENALAQSKRPLADEKPPSSFATGGLALIWAMVENKDATGFLEPFLPLAPRIYAVPLAASQAMHAPQALCALARAHGLEAQTAPSLAEAIALAARHGAKRMVIAGSLYLIGAALAANDSLELIYA